MSKVTPLAVTALLLGLGVSSAWGVAPLGEPAKEMLVYTKSATGLAAGSTYTIRFSLWTTLDLGTGDMVWAEEKSIDLPTIKSITTNLGSVIRLDSVDFSRQYYVQVDSYEGGVYTPIGSRTRLSMVPYAEYALAGGSLTGVSAGDGLTGGGSEGDLLLHVGAGPGLAVTADAVGVATGGITGPMLASNAISTVKINNNAVTSAKLANGAVTAPKLGVACPDGQYLRYAAATGWGCDAGTPGVPGATGPQGEPGTPADTSLLVKKGGDTMSGALTVNNTVTASAFVGNGAALTDVHPATPVCPASAPSPFAQVSLGSSVLCIARSSGTTTWTNAVTTCAGSYWGASLCTMQQVTRAYFYSGPFQITQDTWLGDRVDDDRALYVNMSDATNFDGVSDTMTTSRGGAYCCLEFMKQ